MRRFVAQALHLVDQGQLMIAWCNAVAADTPDRVFLTRAVLIHYKQMFLILGNGQPGVLAIGAEQQMPMAVICWSPTIRSWKIRAVAWRSCRWMPAASCRLRCS